jgi:S-adenosylmethionine decarboxylase
MLKEADLNNYLFGMGTDSMTPEEQKAISKKVFREMREIFYGRNLPDMK